MEGSEMNAEQKQRAKDALQKWHSSNDDSLREYQSAELMAALLQEMITAHEQKPVALVTGYYAEYLSIATVDGWVLPTGTALYAAPPAPSVSDGWKHDCAGILQNDVELWVDSCPHCGKPRPAAPAPAEAPADVARKMKGQQA
jgi:hypothetical protein